MPASSACSRSAIRDEDGVGFKVERGVVRPVWEPDAGTHAALRDRRGIAASWASTLPHGSAGGGSDGNFTGAAGIPTLDGLGVRGAGYHTLDEHIEVDSLARARAADGRAADGADVVAGRYAAKE